ASCSNCVSIPVRTRSRSGFPARPPLLAKTPDETFPALLWEIGHALSTWLNSVILSEAAECVNLEALACVGTDCLEMDCVGMDCVGTGLRPVQVERSSTGSRARAPAPHERSQSANAFGVDTPMSGVASTQAVGDKSGNG